MSEMKKTLKKRVFKQSNGDKVFGIVNGILLGFITLLIVYPIYFVIIASISDPTYVNLGKTLFFPKNITFLGYQKIFEYSEILSGYMNSIKYTVLGTCINMIVCIPCAFALSRKELPWRRFINIFFVFTMYFGGGLIPGYLLIKDLHMINTVWALVIPGALNVYYMIVARSFFQSNIPDELFEATKIDGGSYTTFFFKVVLPLSKSIIAVMVLYHALGHWNSYLTALYYIRDYTKFPLQLVLRNMTAALTNDGASVNASMDAAAIAEAIKSEQSVRYAVIMVASIPVFLMYPFAQKYFVKGVMIGSVKG